MKFGRRISRIAADHPNLAPYYIDYKGLKRLLKTAAHPAADADDVADAQERFALQLESEITKVESCFRAKEVELVMQFRKICRHVAAVEHYPVSDSPSSREFSSFEQLQSLLEGTAEAALIQDLLDFAREECAQHHARAVCPAMAGASEEVTAGRTQVDALRNFVMTCAQAVIKITKKHDKQFSRREGEAVALREYYSQVLHRCCFYNSREFGALIADVEVLALQLIDKLTGSKPSPDDFSCPICLHILSNPIVLSCGHRFCNGCFSVGTYFRQHECPVCRRQCYVDFNSLKVNTLLGRFLDNHFHLNSSDGPASPCSPAADADWGADLPWGRPGGAAFPQLTSAGGDCRLGAPCAACVHLSVLLVPPGERGVRRASSAESLSKLSFRPAHRPARCLPMGVSPDLTSRAVSVDVPAAALPPPLKADRPGEDKGGDVEPAVARAIWEELEGRARPWLCDPVFGAGAPLRGEEKLRRPEKPPLPLAGSFAESFSLRRTVSVSLVELAEAAPESLKRAWPVAKYVSALLALLLVGSNLAWASMHLHARAANATALAPGAGAAALDLDPAGGLCRAWDAAPSEGGVLGVEAAAASADGAKKQKLARLQEARTRSLHKALEKMVARSDGKR